MITAIVKIEKPEGLTLEQYQEMVRTIAARFRDVPGLIRKTFLFSEDEGCAGGVYTWESRAAADACYAGPWRDSIRDNFGVEPEITFFDTPAVVDNEAGDIKYAA